MSSELPSYLDAYQAARDYGDMFVDYGDSTLRTNFSFQAAEGPRQLRIDPRVLGACGTVYADGMGLVQALTEHSAQDVEGLSQAVTFLEDRYRDTSKIIIGFCGFAGHGEPGKPLDYQPEASAINQVYQSLADRRRQPSLTSDGAIRTGVPGLNSLIAQAHFVPSLGYVSLPGLRKMAPHDRMIVKGNTYEDREKLVGMTPDLLLALGGKDGTQRKCEAAIENGCAVLQVNTRYYQKDTFPHTYRNVPALVKAEAEGQFIVCRYGDDLAARLSEAFDRTMDQAIPLRARRFGVLRSHMQGGNLGEAA